MRKAFRIILTIGFLYLLLCLIVYLFQEKLIFLPEKLEENYKYEFAGNVTEVDIPVDENININWLLFKVENSKGLIFYLHGNAGSLENWGRVGETYSQFGYETFVLDYRGYGKSEGKIESEEQLFADNQNALTTLKRFIKKKILLF